MRAYLEEANQDLLYQIAVVQELLGKTSVCGELTPYVSQIIQICEGLRQQVQRNLTDLGYGIDDTLNDILAATQSVTNFFEAVNTRLAAPVVRAKPEDRLGLLILRFLHDSHPKTANLPFGLSDGIFAIYPTDKIPPIYLVPISRQTTLLYLPLLFHEFGHLLYACHMLEMDELVKDIQTVVAKALAPMSVRSKAGATRSSMFRKQVVTSWYAWAQEFYCDAVGLTIGGPCYLKAFSHFFRTRSNDQYYVPRDRQLERRHPVTWLRTKMLADRARKLGMVTLADSVQDAWAETARVLGVQEDYEGTWAEEFFLPLRQMLDDMIEESQPYAHRPTDIILPGDVAKSLSPIQLCNLSWGKFEQGHRISLGDSSRLGYTSIALNCIAVEPRILGFRLCGAKERHMGSHGSASFERHFQDLPDPRVERTRKHPLINIIFMAICSVLSGANSIAGIHEFAIDRRSWFARYLDLTNGVPSEDTFGRVLARIDPAVFEKCLLSWIQAVQELTEDRLVAIDGKTLRGSCDHERDRAAIHMVSAWAAENKLSLGQVVVSEKSNEITAIPKLLELLDISGALVTIDAMGCQREVADQIREGGGDYVLAVKQNQPKLYERVEEAISEALEEDAGKLDEHQTVEKGHGRHETRTYAIVAAPESVDPEELWRDLSAVGIAISDRVDSQGRQSMETRYYILSRLITAPEFAGAVRGHWGIENNLHWQLDVSFREDECRVCRDHAPANLSVIRRFALGLLKRETSCKKGIEIKRMKCAGNDEYREKVLFTCRT